MLRRHSNPTKKKSLVAPANQAFGRFSFFIFLIGFGEFLQVIGGFSTGCGEAASSKTW